VPACAGVCRLGDQPPTGQMIFAAVYPDAARIPGISDVRRELFEYGPAALQW